MQRLFSSFPSGRAGIALLLLRIGLSVILIEAVASSAFGLSSNWSIAALGTAGVLLWLGLLTPAVAGFCLVFEAAALAWSGGPVHYVHACVALHAVSLLLLGPGGYSLDAVLYGRRLIVFPSDDKR